MSACTTRARGSVGHTLQSSSTVEIRCNRAQLWREHLTDELQSRTFATLTVQCPQHTHTHLCHSQSGVNNNITSDMLFDKGHDHFIKIISKTESIIQIGVYYLVKRPREIWELFLIIAVIAGCLVVVLVYKPPGYSVSARAAETQIWVNLKRWWNNFFF